MLQMTTQTSKFSPNFGPIDAKSPFLYVWKFPPILRKLGFEWIKMNPNHIDSTYIYTLMHQTGICKYLHYINKCIYVCI